MPGYSSAVLRGLRRLCPRRPWLDQTVFNKVTELGLLKPFRGSRAGVTQKRRAECGISVPHVNKHFTTSIPTIISNRLHQSFNSNTHSFSNKDKERSINFDNLINVPLVKVTEPPVINCGLVNCRSVKSNPEAIQDLIAENKLNCLALTETWLSPIEDNNKTALANLLPDNFSTCAEKN